MARSYYDMRSRSVANAVTTLRQLQSSRVTADLPSLGDTLAAVRRCAWRARERLDRRGKAAMRWVIWTLLSSLPLSDSRC